MESQRQGQQQTAPSLLVIGGGNMGSAIVHGALRAGIVIRENLLIVEPDAAKCAGFAAMQIQTVGTASEGLAWSKAETTPILLAIKPQVLPGLADECKLQFAGSGRTVISILAGTPIAKLSSLLGAHHHFIRAMPNLPASIGQGSTALHIPPGPDHPHDGFARALFGAVGPTVVPLPEDLFDAFTAVAGSGPAYLFYLAESMQRAAMAQGFGPADAAAITRSTLLGAATMLAQSADDPAVLRERVTSKGGTTEAAFTVLRGANVGNWIELAIYAATKRGQELSR